LPTYPYSSGQTAVVQTFAQLRKGFPSKVDAGYLQRFGIAPANESYIISILRFLGLIDEEGNRREETTQYFYGGDEVFKSGFEQRLRDGYSQVFGEMGDEALTADKTVMTNWFRGSDKTSALVGQRQASTFLTLIALAGHGEPPAVRPTGAKKVVDPSPPVTKATATKLASSTDPPVKASAAEPPRAEMDASTPRASDVGLTVRIEVNLPPGGDADTYDAIFASIKKHLMS